MDTKVENMFYADSYPAAMVVDAAAGSPAVLPSGLTVETERFQLAPILDKAVGFSPQKSRHSPRSHTQMLRPIVPESSR